MDGLSPELPPGAMSLTQPMVTSDPEAERAAIASMLLNEKALDMGISQLTATLFSTIKYKSIFEAITAIVASIPSPHGVDRISLRAKLIEQGTLEAIGGMDGLVSLTTYLPVVEDMAAYITLIKAAALRRSLHKAANLIQLAVKDQSITAEDLMRRTENMIYNIGESYRTTANANATLVQQITTSMNEHDEFLASGRSIFGMSTGYADLDKLTSGFIAGEFIILAARPSMGKTALAMNMILHLIKQKQRVLFFSLEMTFQALIRRFAAMLQRIPMHHYMQPITNDTLVSRISSSYQEFSHVANEQLIISDDSNLDASQIAIQTQRTHRDSNPLSLIVVDYLGLMRPFAKNTRDNQAVKIGEISRALKQLAKSLNVPVLCLAQLNRATTNADRKSAGFRPVMSDLRDSGAIEQDADQIWMIHRPEMYDPDNPDLKHQAEVSIQKNRNGPTGTVHFIWDGTTQRFNPMDKAPVRSFD